MMFTIETLQDLLFNEKFSDLTSVLDCLQGNLQCNIQNSDSISSNLISTDILEEAFLINSYEEVKLYFGKTLKDLKCVIQDSKNSREHDMFFQYKGPGKLIVSSVSLPYSTWQDHDYRTIEELLCVFKKHLEGLAGYFYELECIDKCCTVMDPVNPTFKEDYRRIILDDRTWLHVEVTPDGLATNIYIIGQSDYWQDKLQEGLLKWDHDVDIVRNIMHTFDIEEFPTISNKPSLFATSVAEERLVEKPVCSICLCDELPEVPGVPLPLCQNPTCGIYFHRTCLFQWLVACTGGRPPAFGVATGSCPTCLQPVTCNERDS